MWSSDISRGGSSLVMVMLAPVMVLMSACTTNGRSLHNHSDSDMRSSVACTVDVQSVLLDSRSARDAQWLVFGTSHGDIEFMRVGAGMSCFARVVISDCYLERGTLTCELDYRYDAEFVNPFDADGCIRGKIACSALEVAKIEFRLMKYQWDRENSSLEAVAEEKQEIRFVNLDQK